jgi:hypothetical protein
VTDLLDERAATARAVESTCPRCGAERAPDQRYCVECGAALPPATGRLVRLRRRWLRRFHWYPGDWVWLVLAALVVAAAGAAAAVAVAHHRRAGPARVITALGTVPVAEPTAVPPATRATTAALPTPPEPTTTAAAGRATWPPGQTGWTIVLVSYPKTLGRRTPVRTARQAAKDGLPDVGVLDSSRYPSLQPGYFVVWSGVYDTQAEANAAVETAHQAGFGAAYSRRISG